MRRRSTALLATALIIVVASCSSPHDSVVIGTACASTPGHLGRCEPGTIPEDLEKTTRAEFPVERDDVPTPYSLELRRSPDGVELGVFQRAANGPNAACGAVGAVGPRRLRGAQGIGDGREVLVVSRADLDLVAVCEVALERDPRGRLVASQREAWVPGFGSMPLSISRPANVVSFVSNPAGDDDQRSIVVGVTRGGTTDLRVLRWWLGSDPRAERGGDRYAIDAYAVPEGAPAPPLARLYVFQADGGTVVLVRMAGLTDDEVGAALSSFERIQETKALVADLPP